MPIILPGEIAPPTTPPAIGDLTPREIVAELDRWVVGQRAAKRAVAVALRNRWRRQQLPADIGEEVMPKNIILIGPTGVGKTEIARRLARLARSPFLKIEASKFTEVGYVGRDVESIVRDLTELAVKMVREEKLAEVASTAERHAEERLLDLLLPEPPREPGNAGAATSENAGYTATPSWEETREKFRQRLREGRFDDRQVEVEVKESNFPSVQILGSQGVEEMDINLKDMLPNLFGGRSRSKRMSVAEARTHLAEEERQKLVDAGAVAREAVERVQTRGIVFLDELDKVAGREGGHGPDVSREGVQRDLLPIVEGTTVNTRYGMVRTDHVLFIAAGAFHVAKPADLIPELQGRFPIRVEMESLGEEDFVRILTEPQHALVKQYVALLGTEGVDLTISESAVRALARYAAEVNRRTENIGARRLHTILERVLDEVSFEGPDLAEKRVLVDEAYVDRALAGVVDDQDLSRYVL